MYQFDSNYADTVKSGVIQGLVNRAKMVCCDHKAYREEIERITTVFVNNGYPKKFVDKAVGKQAKSRMQVKPKVDDGKVRTVRIPYVPGLSQEIRRLACSIGTT